ncbi:MAG: OmpA/MotB family protein [Geminicoccaceae bacterium]
MVGMLFFFIILLMAFALNYRSAENEAAATEAELTRERDAVSIEKDRLALERDALASQRDQLARERDRIAAERDEISAVTDHLMRDNRIRTDMLATVLSLLRERQVEVTLDPENGIVRLPESLLFDTGEAVLQPRGVRALRELAAVLALTLPCYSRASAIQQSDCPTVSKPLLEAVLVEGHTDDRPIRTSTFANNWELGSARAINTYKALLAYEPSLSELLNERGEALLGVSNYEAQRPVSLGPTPEDRRLNRRIDLRFLIAAPSEAQLDAIRERMHAPEAAQGAPVGAPPAPEPGSP